MERTLETKGADETWSWTSKPGFLLEDTGDVFVVSSAYWQLDSKVIILFPGERSQERLSATTPKIEQSDYKCLINEVTARNEDQVFSRETSRQDT